MDPRLFHIFGPIWINSYGLMISLGLLVTALLSYHSSLRKRLVSGDFYLNTIFFATIVGFIGGRIMYLFTNWQSFAANPIEVLYPWEGGFSLLGSFVCVPLFLWWYLSRNQVPILPFFDFVALYIPLLQAIARIGCHLAGCCYGISISKQTWYSIIYNHPDSLAPLHVFLHPTQLYSSALSFIIFCILQISALVLLKTPGKITALFFALEGFARFIIDFWRGDRCGLLTLGGAQSTYSDFVSISSYQLLALILSLGGIIGFFILKKNRDTK
jgi:phosphatidylglycerol:prolipoprotein diacylglycerol transferase